MLVDKYKIFPNGTVKNIKTNKFLKNQDNGKGYRKITLTINGKPYQNYVHRLVATAYIKNPKGYKQVNHIDGNKSNNLVENLEWTNNSLNQIHAHKTGLKKNGNKLWNGKFSKEDIDIMKDYDSKGFKRVEIAKMFECSKSTISEILNGNRYKY
tara:strand:+ start:2029 stop:2490 length:462 start_codon:yes stop_codon:yes gene_type:complete